MNREDMYSMTQFQARLIVLVDEWLGWAAMLYLYEHKSAAFWPCFVFFFVCVYVVAYPLYWRRWDRWWSCGASHHHGRKRKMKKYAPKYDRYIEIAMQSAPPEGPDREQFLRDLDESIRLFEEEDTCINAGKCPGCGGPLAKIVDERQVGPVELALRAGTWINYRCASDPLIGTVGPRTCAWRGVDRKEPLGVN